MMVVIFSPIYPPYRGGAAEYIPWLQKTIAERITGTVRIVTESHPDAPSHVEDGTSSIDRTLLSAVNYRGLTIVKVLRFAIQNFQYLGLMRQLVAAEPRILWFHGALFIRASVLTPVIRLLKYVGGHRIKIVLDFRDPSIPNRRLRKLSFADEVIVCCRRIGQKLESSGFPSGSFRHIPVPYTPGEKCAGESSSWFRSLDIEDSEYLFAPHGVRDDKNFPLVFDIWRKLRVAGHVYKLVVAGPVHAWHAKYQEAWEKRDLVVTGEIRNKEVRGLMRRAVLVFSIGRMEGLPRSVLEAIEAGTLVALPPAVPEFQVGDLDLVIDTEECDSAAEKVADIIRNRRRPAYELCSHNEGNVKTAYWALLDHLIGQ